MSDLTLAEFLAARLDEDEAAAKAAARYGQWSSKPWYSGEIHIARHSPARVLRDVEAGRKILAMWHDGNTYSPDRNLSMMLVAETLASVYSDHPDYREEWKP